MNKTKKKVKKKFTEPINPEIRIYINRKRMKNFKKLTMNFKSSMDNSIGKFFITTEESK